MANYMLFRQMLFFKTMKIGLSITVITIPELPANITNI